jgi:hypothetical protein
MKAGYETQPGGFPEGRDPRRMTQAELQAMGHEPMSPQRAIRAHCLDCCGGSPDEVRKCTALTCPSWPFRMGSSPWKQKRTMSPEQRSAAIERLTLSRKIKSGAIEHTNQPALSAGNGF